MPDELKPLENAPVIPVTPTQDTPTAPAATPVSVPSSEVTPAPAPEPKPVEKLSEEELNTQLKNAFSSEPPKEPPVTADTPKDKTPAEGTPPTPPVAEKMLAGKYKTEDELVKGITNLAKTLGHDESSLTGSMVKIAIDSKNTPALEAMYKRMETELGKRSSSAKPPESAPTQANQTADQQRDFVTRVAKAASEAIADDPRVLAMKRDGFEVPTTQEEFDELKRVAYHHFAELRAAFQEKYNEYYREGQEYQKAVTTVDTVNQETITKDSERIRALAKENGIDITDAEIKELSDSILADPSALEERHGVAFLRDGSLYRAYVAEKFIADLPKVRAAISSKSRTEAVEDLKKAKSMAVDTISTSPTPGRASVTAKPTDLADEKALRQMSKEELDERLVKAFKGE